MVIGRLLKFLKKENNDIKNKIKNLKKKPQKKKIAKKKTSIKKKTEKKDKLIAEAVHYFAKINVCVLKLKAPLKINDKIFVKGHTTNFKQVVTSLQIDHSPVKEAKKGQEIGLKVKRKVRRGDKIYKI